MSDDKPQKLADAINDLLRDGPFDTPATIERKGDRVAIFLKSQAWAEFDPAALTEGNIDDHARFHAKSLLRALAQHIGEQCEKFGVDHPTHGRLYRVLDALEEEHPDALVTALEAMEVSDE